MSGRVVVVGSLNLDLVVGLQRMPDRGESVLGDRLEQHAGGKGLNPAVAVARLGVPVSLVGALGSDAAAEFLRGVARDEGIDDRAVAALDGTSGTALIEVDAAGDNRIVVVPGTNAAVGDDQVRASLAALDDVAVVLTQFEVPVEAAVAAMAAGRAMGARTVLNTAPVRDFPDELLSLVDVVISNEHEAALLAGTDTSTTEGATAAARELVRRGAACAVVTRGAEGAVWATADAAGACPAFRIVPVDTVGAGDAFCGGMSAALAEGRGIEEALRWGSACGALAATAAGAVPSLPRRATVEALLGADAT
jgi:ribokinase